MRHFIARIDSLAEEWPGHLPLIDTLRTVYDHRASHLSEHQDGPDGHATLLDFGILRSSRSGDNLTRTGMVMGTPHYMAPEQALGSKDVDHRVDLYALAVVAFEALSGTLPFEADSELRLIQMQAHQPPPDLLERAPWIPKPVAEVMKRALAKKPKLKEMPPMELKNKTQPVKVFKVVS